MSLRKRLALRLGFVALLGLAAAHPCQAASQPVLSDPLSTWPLNFGGEGNSITEKDGAVHIILSPSTANWGIYNGFDFTNMDASVTVVSNAKGGNIGGLVFWASSPNDFFVFSSADIPGTFAVFHHIAGTPSTWRNIVPFMKSAAIKTGQPNTLRVVTKGNSLALFINGQSVGQLGIMAPAGGGSVGIEAESANGQADYAFSNLIVSQ
jgi:hypothetical protein